MAELKNTFVKSKMNKDLDSRLITNGEYREAMNVSVSTSEGSDVGALENIRGNFKLSDFGLTDNNLEVIGNFVDVANNRIYFFITNFADGTRSQLDGQAVNSSTATALSLGTFVRNGSKNCIAYCEIPYLEDSQLSGSSIISNILVEGTFLNFSKTHPMLGINLVEDLLFFTDNRNQPRKINVKTAIANPLTYYVSEDDISVAKVAPFKPISFLNETVTPAVSTLKNEVEEWLPATFIAPALVYNGNSPIPVTQDMLLFDNGNFGSSANPAPYASPLQHFGINPTSGTGAYDIRVYLLNDENRNYAYVRNIQNAGTEDAVYLQDKDGNDITNINTSLGWGTPGERGSFAFEIKNPDYNSFFAGDQELLKDKFVKFSYRFKYDDDEYSIIAPFSQAAFVPKQYGYFIGVDNNKTKDSSIVSFMENQITTAGLVVDMPYSVTEIGAESGKKLKVKEVQLLYKASDEKSLKVISDVKMEEVNGIPSSVSILYSGDGFNTTANKTTTGGNGSGLTLSITGSGAGVTAVSINNPGSGYKVGDVVTITNPLINKPAQIRIDALSSTFIYDYSSQKPIKVLDEQEIIRVNDIIPIRAKAQEVVGNRVVYGNFLQNLSTPGSLNYDIMSVNKGSVLNNNKVEFLNHTLKQGRTYQVGLVLQDRYGRSSNVIVNNNTSSSTLNSTFFAPYSNGGVDPLNWPGNSLKVSFKEKIPNEKTSTYSGIWDEVKNPLGWYTYKVVVKQQEQDYYNVYVPGCLSGNVNFKKLNLPLTYDETSEKAHIALFNDNINKVPRDLSEVGPSDRVYGSSTVLYNRVKNSSISSTVPDINEQNTDTSSIEITTVRPFREFGEWATMKNVNIKFIEAIYDPNAGGTGGLVGPYNPQGSNQFIYPGDEGQIDPFYLQNNKNPLIATLKTTSRLGYNAINQQGANFNFAKKLMVFETKPVKSALDIYYETSSTGLVSSFNTSVAYPTGSSGQPVDLSSFIATWQESISYPIDVTNVFQCVDSNGNIITTGNPQIRIDSVLNSTTNTIVSSPFTLSVVQQAGFNTPETYKLTTNGSFIYKSNSYSEDSLLINFKLTADGMQDVIVQKSVSLSNIAPKIYRVAKAYIKDYEKFTNTPAPFIEEASPASIIQFTNSAVLNWSASPVDSSGNDIDYSTVKTALILGREYLTTSGGYPQEKHIATISHSTNGSEVVLSPSSSNVNQTSTLRQEGLVYEIKSVTRYRCGFRPQNNTFRRIYSATTGNSQNKTSDFIIKGNGEINTNFDGTFPNKDWNWFTQTDYGGYDPAYMYIVGLGVKDAGGVGQGAEESTFTFFFILTKKDYK